jgi:hypothetical protein
MAVRAPPGGGGEDGRPVLAPVAGALTGDDALGEDCIFAGQLAGSHLLGFCFVAGSQLAWGRR